MKITTKIDCPSHPYIPKAFCTKSLKTNRTSQNLSKSIAWINRSNLRHPFRVYCATEKEAHFRKSFRSKLCLSFK